MTGEANAPQGMGPLVDDDELYLRTLQRSLQKRGFTTVTANNSSDALVAASEQRPSFALIDLKLGSTCGLALIEPLRAVRDDMRILMVTGYASIATAVEAIKRGADNYLMKPVTAEAIVRALNDEIDSDPTPENTMVSLARVEWEHIQQALAETQGNISAAARLLGTHRRSLQRKLGKRPGPERMGE